MAKFISNNEKTSHKHVLQEFFKGAKRLDWHIAFASKGGVKAIKDDFVAFLAGGGVARVIVGLDYFHTDPGVLEFFHELSENYSDQMSFYVSADGRQSVFHPKVYVFHYGCGAAGRIEEADGIQLCAVSVDAGGCAGVD